MLIVIRVERTPRFRMINGIPHSFAQQVSAACALEVNGVPLYRGFTSGDCETKSLKSSARISGFGVHSTEPEVGEIVGTDLWSRCDSPSAHTRSQRLRSVGLGCGQRRLGVALISWSWSSPSVTYRNYFLQLYSGDPTTSGSVYVIFVQAVLTPKVVLYPMHINVTIANAAANRLFTYHIH